MPTALVASATYMHYRALSPTSSKTTHNAGPRPGGTRDRIADDVRSDICHRTVPNPQHVVRLRTHRSDGTNVLFGCNNIMQYLVTYIECLHCAFQHLNPNLHYDRTTIDQRSIIASMRFRYIKLFAIRLQYESKSFTSARLYVYVCVCDLPLDLELRRDNEAK